MGDESINQSLENRVELVLESDDALRSEKAIEQETRAYISEKSTEHVIQKGLFRYITEPYTALSLFAMSLGWLAAAWGFNTAAAILTLIAADIDPQSHNATLFSIAWSMGMAVGYLLVGRLSDILGRRWVIISFNVLGFVGGLVAGTAKSLDTLIGANILIGLAGGAQFAAMVIATELLPNKHKMVTMAGIMFMVFPGAALSPYLGRLLYETASWRWIYYIYTIIVAVVLTLFFFFYHPHDSVNVLSMYTRIRRLDFGGMFLASAGLTLFTLSLSWGGNPQPWNSALVLGTLVGGIVALILLVVYEIYMPLSDPFLPMKLFKDIRGFTMLLVIASAGGISFVGLHIVWPTQALRFYGTNSDWQSVAWMSATMGFGTWGATILFGPFWSKIGHVKWQLVFWCVWMTAFSGALMAVSPDNKAYAAAISFLAGMPVGYLENQTGMLVQLIAPEGESGTYFGANQGIRTAIGSVGSAIFVAILNNKLAPTISSYLAEAVLPLGLPQSSLASLAKALGLSGAARTAAFAAVPQLTPVIQAAAEQSYSAALIQTYKYMYCAAVAFGACSIVAALCLRDMDHLLTNHVPKSNGHSSREVKVMAEEIEYGMHKNTRGGA